MSKSRLEQILTRRLKLLEPHFRIEKAGTKLSGSIVSDTFSGKSDHERQRLIWDALDRELGSNSSRDVGTILAYTPDEWNIGFADAPAPRRRSKAL